MVHYEANSRPFCRNTGSYCTNLLGVVLQAHYEQQLKHNMSTPESWWGIAWAVEIVCPGSMEEG